MTEYIFFNNVALKNKVPELVGIEIIPIFSKFNYIFFSELAKKLRLEYRFLLDKDENFIRKAEASRKTISEEGDKESNTKIKPFQNCRHIIKCSREKLHRRFWEIHGRRRLSEEEDKGSIIHSKNSDISWFPHDLEDFLDIGKKDPHVVSKELNIISNIEFAINNLDEEKIAKLRELPREIAKKPRMQNDD